MTSSVEFTVIFMIAFAIATIFMIFYFKRIAPFLSARKHIKMEMKRSEGDERAYWKKELRRLYTHLFTNR